MLPAILTQRFLTGVVREYPTEAFIGASILPMEPVPGMETMWDIIMKDAKLAPFVAIDGESELADKAGMQRGFSELTNIRIKEMLNETDLLALRMPGDADVVTGLQATQRSTAERKIRQTVDRMAARVWGRVEWMRWQALSTGRVTYASDKVNFSVDFGIPSNQKLSKTGTAQWSNTTHADPISDINTCAELILAASGRVATRMVVGMNVPAYLVNNAKIRDLLKANGAITSLISTKTVLEALGDILGLKIERYATKYQNDAGTDAYFLDADSFVMFADPVQADGETLGDVATGPAKANDWETGIYSWVKEETDPWATFVGAGIHAFPRLRHPNWICCVDTCGGAG